MRLDISESQPLFGQPARLYGPVIAGVVSRLDNVAYRFWSNDGVAEALRSGSLSTPEYNAIAVTELLLSAHLGATSSLIRSARWFEATWREHQVDNLLGWAACCRSLLESIGDTIDGLLGMGLDLADNMPMLMRGLTGKDDDCFDLGPLEDKLIHFSHARKIRKADKTALPTTHVAKHTTDYIALLESAGGPVKLYAELCEIGHPARGSLSWMYAPIDGGFRIDSGRDASKIAEIVVKHRIGLETLPSIAFNPGLMVLRVLVKFGLFPLLPELRNFSFQGARGWDKIKLALAGAPPTLKRTPLVDKLVALTRTVSSVELLPR